MELITIESQAFQLLFEKLVEKIRAEHKDIPDRWISGDEAMRMLRIKSKTTMSMLRATGKLRYSQPERKIILYDVQSIHEYLNTNAKETF